MAVLKGTLDVLVLKALSWAPMRRLTTNESLSWSSPAGQPAGSRASSKITLPSLR